MIVLSQMVDVAGHHCSYQSVFMQPRPISDIPNRYSPPKKTRHLFDMHQIWQRLFPLDFKNKWEVVMSEKIKSKMISRRGAFSLLGLATALSLVVPATVMTATDAEAVVGRPLSPVSVAGAHRRAERRSKKKKKKAK